MSVTGATTRNDYIATTGQTVFAYTFQILSGTDVKVVKDGVTLTYSTDYSVSNVGVAGGGNITLVVGATNSQKIAIYLAMPIDRTTQYLNAGDFLASDVNGDFDKGYVAMNQLQTDIKRAVRLQDQDPTVSVELPLSADRANKYLKFGVNGEVGVGEAGTVVNADDVLYTLNGSPSNAEVALDLLFATAPSYIFDTVADMIASDQVSIGTSAQTLGYSVAGDGGGNLYKIVANGTGTADGGAYIDLNGIAAQAKAMWVDNAINARAFPSINAALNYAHDLSMANGYAPWPPNNIEVAQQLVYLHGNDVEVSAPVVIKPGVVVDFTAKLKASSSFSGTSLVKTEESATTAGRSIASRIRSLNLDGNNKEFSDGGYVINSTFTHYVQSITVNRVDGHGIRIKDDAGAVRISKARINGPDYAAVQYNTPGTEASNYSAPAGIYVQKADFVVDDAVVSNLPFGIWVDGAQSGKLLNCNVFGAQFEDASGTQTANIMRIGYRVTGVKHVMHACTVGATYMLDDTAPRSLANGGYQKYIETGNTSIVSPHFQVTSQNGQKAQVVLPMYIGAGNVSVVNPRVSDSSKVGVLDTTMFGFKNYSSEVNTDLTGGDIYDIRNTDVSYFSGNNSTKVFTLAAPNLVATNFKATSDVLVLIDGDVLDRDDGAGGFTYTVEPSASNPTTESTLTFVTAPATGTNNVQVSFVTGRYLFGNLQAHKVGDYNLKISGYFGADNIQLEDDKKIRLGDDQDFQVYHTGNNSFIDDKGTGDIFIRSNGTGVRLTSNPDNVPAGSFVNGDSYSIVTLGETLAGYFVSGTAYKIVDLGGGLEADVQERWNTYLNTTGVTYVVGGSFTGTSNDSSELFRAIAIEAANNSQWNAYLGTSGVTYSVGDAFSGTANNSALIIGAVAGQFSSTMAEFNTEGSVKLRYAGSSKLETITDGVKVTGKVQVNTITIASGSGSPEGSVTAIPGSLYTNTSGGSNTTLYVKESGTGNTGWIAK